MYPLAFPRYKSWHDVQRVSDGVIVGSILATWDGDGSGQIMENGLPSGAVFRGAQSYGNVPKGALDVFSGIYGERAADARGKYRFIPSPDA